MEKPHTGLDDCLNMPLLCQRKRKSAYKPQEVRIRTICRSSQDTKHGKQYGRRRGEEDERPRVRRNQLRQPPRKRSKRQIILGSTLKRRFRAEAFFPRTVTFPHSLHQRGDIQPGTAGWGKGFATCFLEVPLLAWAAWQLQFSPTACRTHRKHATKPFPQHAAPLALDAAVWDKWYAK